MIRAIFIAFFAVAAAFGPATPRIMRKTQVEMSLGNKVSWRSSMYALEAVLPYLYALFSMLDFSCGHGGCFPLRPCCLR